MPCSLVLGKAAPPASNNCPANAFDPPQKFILTALLLAVACGISGAAAARTPGHTYMQVWGMGAARCQLRGAQLMQGAAIFQVGKRQWEYVLVWIVLACRSHFASRWRGLPWWATLRRQCCGSRCAVLSSWPLPCLPSPTFQNLPGWVLSPALPLPLQALWLVAMNGAGIAIIFLAVTLILPVTSHQLFRQQMAMALGQLASVSEATVSVILPSRGAGAQQGSSEQQEGGSGPQGGLLEAEQAEARQGRQGHTGTSGQFAPAAATATATDAAESWQNTELPSSPLASGSPAATTTPLAAAEQLPQTPPAAATAAAGEAAAPPPPPQHHVSACRLQLGQQPSLIVLPPQPAALSGSSRKQLGRAVRQLRAPAGPELMADCEDLLGKMCSRFFFESFQVRALLGL